MASVVTTIDDSVDYIMEIVSTKLLRTRNINFGKLKRISTLAEVNVDSTAYCNVIILAILHYFEIGADLTNLVENSSDALRFYNALNLNDDRINTFFVELVIVLVPELLSTLAAIVNEITRDILRTSSGKVAAGRLSRLEIKLNNKIKQEQLAYEEIDYDNSNVIIPRSNPVEGTRIPSNTLRLLTEESNKERSKLISRFGEKGVRADEEIISNKSRGSDSQKSRTSSYLRMTRELGLPDRSRKSSSEVSGYTETAVMTAQRILNSRARRKESSILPDESTSIVKGDIIDRGYKSARVKVDRRASVNTESSF